MCVFNVKGNTDFSEPTNKIVFQLKRQHSRYRINNPIQPGQCFRITIFLADPDIKNKTKTKTKQYKTHADTSRTLKLPRIPASSKNDLKS